MNSRDYITPTINRAHPLNCGLAGWWLTLPNQSGYVWSDIMNGKRATPVGTLPATINTPAGVTWKKGIPGGSSQFTTDWYWDTGLTTLNSVTSYSYSFWGRKNATSSVIGLGVATAGGTSQSNRDSALMFSDGTTYVAYGAGYYSFSGWGQSTEWRHLVVCYDGGQSTNATKFRVYMNGIPITSGTYNGTVPTTSVSHSGATFIIGRDPGLPNYSRGFFDDVRVWNRSLSASEAYGVYADSLAAFGQTILRSQSLSPIKTKTLNNYVLTAQSGTYSLAGSNATLKQAKLLTASSGSYVMAGSNASLTVQKKLTATTGTFSLTGNNADLRTSRVLSATSGAFALTGNDVALAAQRKITCSVGAYAITGNSAALNRGFTLTATSGDFSLAGSDAVLRKDSKLYGVSSAFVLSGSDVSLVANRKLSCSSAAFTLSVSDVSLLIGRKLSATSGSFSFTASDIALICNRILTANAGLYAFTGNQVTLTVAFPADFIKIGAVYLSVSKLRDVVMTMSQCELPTISVPKISSAHIQPNG